MILLTNHQMVMFPTPPPLMTVSSPSEQFLGMGSLHGSSNNVERVFFSPVQILTKLTDGRRALPFGKRVRGLKYSLLTDTQMNIRLSGKVNEEK